MDWEEDMQLPTGNEIRFADEILPGRQDDIPAVGGDEIRPLVGRRGWRNTNQPPDGGLREFPLCGENFA